MFYFSPDTLPSSKPSSGFYIKWGDEKNKKKV
jgi:hypothetical protein